MKSKTVNQTGGKPRTAGLPRDPRRNPDLYSKSLASRWVLAGILSLGLFQTQTTFGQEAVPYNEFTNDIALPTNALASAAESPPPSPQPLELGNSPAPAVGFQGLDDDNRLSPPDTDGCVGLNHVVTMLNTQVRIQNRAGTTNYSTVTLSNWWATKVTGVTYPFDPRIVYDPFSHLWIATAAAQPQSSASSILVAVSQTDDPTGSWYAWSILVDSTALAWGDFPTLGFNKDRIVVSFNFLTISGNSPDGVGILALNKTNLYAGTYSQEFWDLPNATYGMGITPAVSYDPSASSFYLLQNFANNQSGTGYLAMFTITGAFGSGGLTRLSTFPSASGWSGGVGANNFAPQLGTTNRIHCGDSRLSQVVHRDGALWCAQTIFLPASNPTRCSVQWWQIRTNATVLQQGRLDDPNGVYFYAYPSISVNRFGDALIGYSRFATNEYARANYSFHAFNDPANSLQAEYLFQAGASPYWKIPPNDSRNRWGDYSMTCVDPVNDTDFWTIQEYAAQYVGTLTNRSGRWGVWWANLQAATPINDYFSNATAVSGQQGTTNGTNLRALKEASEPNHAGNAGGASIWYTWTAPASGSVAVDTIGSSFNTLLAVYTGSSVGSLTLVASDNDSGGLGTSKLIFTATSGITYRIAVDGFGGVMGNVVLNWLQPTAPVFTTHPQSQGGIAGNTVSFSATAIGAPTPGYQWRFNGANVAGATSSSYAITNVTQSDAGSYAVVATNSSGSVTSAVAVLTVYDSATATLTAVAYTNSQFQFFVNGVTNDSYTIQASTNLSNWATIHTNIAPFTFTDVAATNYPYRFYRAVH